MLWSCWLSGSPVDSHHPHSATEKTSQSFKRYNPRKVFWEGSKKFDARDNTHFWLIWRLLDTYWILMVNDVLRVSMRRHRYLPAFSRLEAMPRPSPMKSCWRTKSQLNSFKVLFCIAEFEFCSFGRCSHGETLWSQDPSTKEFYDVFRFLISQLELQSRDLWDASRHANYAKKWPLDSSLWYSYSWWLKQHFLQLCRLSHRFLYPVPNFSLQDPQLEVEGKMEDEAVGWLEWRVRGKGFCRGQNWWGGEFVLWQAKLFVVGSLVESQGHKAFLAFVAGSWLIQSIQIDEASSNQLSILTFERQTSKVHSTATWWFIPNRNPFRMGFVWYTLFHVMIPDY